jgi:hypothetical protein
MEVARAKRVPIWVFVLSGLLIGIPLLLFAVHQIIRSLETRRWAEMRRWCEDVAKEVRSRDSRRPVLRGVALDGNAWDDYRIALDTLGSKLDMSPITNVLWRTPSADRAKARAFLDRYAPALQALRSGASRSHAQLRTDWENGSDNANSKINHLALLAACQARVLAEEGQRREAMELLLDAAQYAEDTAFNGSFIDGLVGI